MKLFNVNGFIIYIAQNTGLHFLHAFQELFPRHKWTLFIGSSEVTLIYLVWRVPSPLDADLSGADSHKFSVWEVDWSTKGLLVFTHFENVSSLTSSLLVHVVGVFPNRRTESIIILKLWPIFQLICRGSLNYYIYQMFKLVRK